VSTEQAAADKPRVLVVDDSRVIRVAARKILKDEFEPVEAGDGEEAWELLNKDTEIALVLSDLSMPYLDGMGLLQRLRTAENQRLRDLPMIIVTGAEDDDEAKTRAFAAGATDFISKPFDSVQLLAHTRSHIRLQKTAEELKQTTTVLQESPATDPFTGLGNQRAFLERGQQGLAYAIRHRTELAMVLFQVDGFDQIFVRHGKAIGGAILKTVTAALQAEIRREDTAARISMARFGLILPSANPIGVKRLAARVCERIARTPVKDKDGAPLSFTLSAGVIAPDVNQMSRFEQLLGVLVKRLEQAMAQGNCVVFDEASGAVAPCTAVEAGTRPAESTATAVATPVPAAAEATEPMPVVAPAVAVESEPAPRPQPAPELAAALALLEAWNHEGQHGLDTALAQLRAALTGH
jgi:two-component system, cell cycle response regulator